MPLLLALLLLALLPSSASAVTISGPWWAQRAVDGMQAPVVDRQVLRLESCPGWPELAACNFPTPDSAIYIPRRFYSRIALARELGGRFDAVAMTPSARHHFMAIMRYRGEWWNDDAAFTGLVEQFEDAYADCALAITRRNPTLQDPHDEWIDSAGYRPSRRQHQRVCALIGRVGEMQGLIAPAARPRRSGSSSAPALDTGA